MSENNKKITGEECFSYEKMIEEVARDVCSKNSHPTCAKYEEAVVAIKNKAINNKAIDYNIKPRDIHSNIYRALQRLVKKHRFFRMANGYYPDTQEYRRAYYANQIERKLSFARGEIYNLSENACIIILDDSELSRNYSISDKETIELFEEYIGNDSLYSVKKINDLILIMLCENSDKEATRIGHIKSLVKEVYKKEQSSKKKSLYKTNALRNALGEDYSYYWFDKDVYYDDVSVKKRFLFLNCNQDRVEKIYTIIKSKYSDLCESIYLGSASVTLVFTIYSDGGKNTIHDKNSNAESDYFEIFLQHIKDKSQKNGIGKSE